MFGGPAKQTMPNLPKDSLNQTEWKVIIAMLAEQFTLSKYMLPPWLLQIITLVLNTEESNQ